jgi:hypothetical protein
MVLSKQEQSWLLVGFPDAPDYVEFAWAALRPPRKSTWERHAQIRSDGYLSPPSFMPKYPEPKKWYKRQPGQDYVGSCIHPARCQHLRMLVRLSDALTEAAVDTMQDWFMIDLRSSPDTPPVTVGDLLAFGVKIVGNERFRPGHLAISAGLPNARLWKYSMRLTTLWNYLDIALLRPGSPTVAFTSLTDTTSIVTLGEHGNADNEEKVYFAMAAVTALPEWVRAPETQNPRNTETFTTCCLPHEPLKEIAHPASASAPNRKAVGAKKPSRR